MTIQDHQPVTADAEHEKCSPADTDLHFYVPAPQSKRAVETHAHEPPTTCMDQLELSFETAGGSVQHEKSTAAQTSHLPMYNSNPLQYQQIEHRASPLTYHGDIKHKRAKRSKQSMLPVTRSTRRLAIPECTLNRSRWTQGAAPS